MSTTRPMTALRRAGIYARRGAAITPVQRRRFRHKVNRANRRLFIGQPGHGKSTGLTPQPSDAPIGAVAVDPDGALRTDSGTES